MSRSITVAGMLLCLLFTALTLVSADSDTNSTSPPLSFTNISASSGIQAGSSRNGHGVMWSDVDNDGDADLYITHAGTGQLPDLFFRNNGNNTFDERGAAQGIADVDGGSHGACFGDLNNDGDFDLFNGTTDGTSSSEPYNNIYRNNGAGFFTDVTTESGLSTLTDWPTRGVLCFDMDNDGDLDLVAISNYRGSDDPPAEDNEVYRNNGNGTFVAVSGGALRDAPAGQGAIDTDFDGDGDVDVLAANRTGPVNILRNNGNGVFTQVTPSSLGINKSARDGISSADIDNDGDLDLLLSSDNSASLMRNNGSTFSHMRDFSSTSGYMGAFGDLDNDGDLDLVFAGDNNVFLNNGAGIFSNGPSLTAGSITDPRAVALADMDNDGDLDFAVGANSSPNALYRNNLNGGNWLKLNLVTQDGQRGAFGATVTVRPANGGSIIGFREARSGGGYLGQDDSTLHVGLGAHTSVDVTVRYLTGEVVELDNVSAQQTITVDPTVETPSGDVTCDGRTDTIDALFILQHDVDLRTGIFDCPIRAQTLYLPACDVDGQSNCNTIDALFILQCDVGIANVLCPDG